MLNPSSQFLGVKHFPLSPMAITVGVSRVSEQRPPGDAGDMSCKTRGLSLGHIIPAHTGKALGNQVP